MPDALAATETPLEPTPPPAREDLWTVPNILCFIRLPLTPVLILLAWLDEPYWCLGLALVLLFMDWLDGKLAILLKQQTVFGARLDSFADALLYLCLLAAVLVLRWETIYAEALWIGLALASYVLSVTAGLIKFRRVPSYHTRLAKASWLLMVIAVIATLGDWSEWPLRIAMIGVLLTNLEATAITIMVNEWRVNVPSLYHALRKEA